MNKAQAAGRWRIKSEDLPLQRSADCLKQSLPAELGVGLSTIFQLDQDLNFIQTHYQPTRDLAVLTQIEQSEPRLVVTLGLQGQSCFVDRKGNDIVFKEGFTSITAFNGSRGERQYQADSNMLQLRFSMSKTWLERYFGEYSPLRLFNKSDISLLSHKPISNTALLATQQLLGCDMASPVKHVFMHAQAMSILAAEISSLWQANHKISERFNQKDEMLAQAARAILLKEFKNPPSVAALAKRIGTNQLKLKKIFHYFFNNTPYGLLLEIRMNKAYQLLEASGCQIDVAADFVGYSHASNFSAAFSKYFGISPSNIAKSYKAKA